MQDFLHNANNWDVLRQQKDQHISEILQKPQILTLKKLQEEHQVSLRHFKLNHYVYQNYTACAAAARCRLQNAAWA